MYFNLSTEIIHSKGHITIIRRISKLVRNSTSRSNILINTIPKTGFIKFSSLIYISRWHNTKANIRRSIIKNIFKSKSSKFIINKIMISMNKGIISRPELCSLVLIIEEVGILRGPILFISYRNYNRITT